MSEWVVHFTNSQATLASILADGEVRATGPFGWCKNLHGVQEHHKSACFSEIPLDHLGRLFERHGRWGIGFSRSFITEKGGGRVWYLEKGQGPGQALFDLIGGLITAPQQLDHPVFQLTPFIDAMADEPYKYRFDWEREWRIPGGLAFEPANVAFLMTPGGINPYPYGAPVPTISSTSPEEFADHVEEALYEERDEIVQAFLQRFTDPANELPWDDGYVWVATQWPTEDAVAELFGTAPDLAGVIEELNDLSPYWVDTHEDVTI